ncbi:MAG: glycerate kinase [Dehalococcoidia bacterium]|nr:Glycerate 2-kinase [Chloroflexota bacterium]MBT9162909.1 Glycerate 2-kinase [Chloroflexota bacterium]
MKIVIAPQGFKGNLTALQVAQAIDRGIARVMPSAMTTIKPMADGGEGTVQALVDATGGEMMLTEVTDPLGGRVMAHWGVLGDKVTAVIEMAAASGLILVPPARRNPLVTTTYGTGELILAALDRGCRKLIIGVGGSATNDGGAGMAQALGVQLLDFSGATLPWGGGALVQLEHINVTTLDPRLADCEVLLACDVTNPLCGAEGASAIYGPQKGATPEIVVHLDAALAHYADVIQSELGLKVKDIPGAGAAGGLGAGIIAFLGAEVMPGIDIVIQTTGLVEHLKDADLVFTGEGRIDRQTAFGKVATGVARRAKEFSLPVIAITGEIADDYRVVYQHGIDAVLSIAPGPISVEQSMAEAERLIADAAECAMRLFLSGIRGRFSNRFEFNRKEKND